MENDFSRNAIRTYVTTQLGSVIPAEFDYDRAYIRTYQTSRLYMEESINYFLKESYKGETGALSFIESTKKNERKSIKSELYLVCLGERQSFFSFL